LHLGIRLIHFFHYCWRVLEPRYVCNSCS